MNSPCPYICDNKTEYGYCKTTGCINPKTIKDVFYDGYAYCLMDFGKDTVLCKDCKHKNTDKCPMADTYNCEWVTWSNADDYCSKGERKEVKDE